MDYEIITAIVMGTTTVCFLGYLFHRNERLKRESQHAERMKALENGQDMAESDYAWAAVDIHRYWVIAMVGLLLPMGIISAAGVVTILLLRGNDASPSALLYVIWIVCGLISLVAVFFILVGLFSSEPSTTRGDDDDSDDDEPEPEPEPEPMPAFPEPRGSKWRKRR